MKRIGILSVAAAFAAGACLTPAGATDQPLEAVPGKIVVIKTGNLAKFVAKAPSGSTFELPAEPDNDPVTQGGTLRIRDATASAGDMTFALPAQTAPLGWRRIPGNTTKALKGFKYKGAGSAGDPCKVVIVKEKVLKAVCKGTDVTFDPVSDGGAGDVVIRLDVGSGTKSYCTGFGAGNSTELKNESGLLKRKASSGAICTCTGPPTQFEFANGVFGVGNCGTLTGGTINNNLTCGGLYFGGALATPDLPAPIGDTLKAAVFNVTECCGDDLALTFSTLAETGDIETCTDADCFFGAPVPVVNASSIPTSTCLYNRYQPDVGGTVNCTTGEAFIDQPIFTDVYLTGDGLKFRCDGASPSPGLRCSGLGDVTTCTPGACIDDSADVQPCPICNPVTGVCNGGANNGSACTVGTPNQTGTAFPTSRDCTVGPVLLVGTLNVPFELTTGTSSKVSFPSGTQSRVFCGFCRDADDTGAFGICVAPSQNEGDPCSVVGDCGLNGVCVEAPCDSDADCTADVREACEQRNEGAFKNGAATDYALVGSPAGDMNDAAAHPMTLVTATCSPPTFNAIVDPSGDLPSPVAVSLPGTGTLSP